MKGNPLGYNQGFEYREQIGNGSAGITVLAHLAGTYRHSSEAQWRERLDRGEILLNGAPACAGMVLRPGHVLTWRRPPWIEPDAPLGFALLYEDRHLLAVAKPSGLPTLPGGGFLEHTLLALVRHRYPEAVPCHRLGRATSGVVLFARTAKARSALAKSLRNRESTKIYRALACGVPEQSRFAVHIPIGAVPHPRLGSVHAVHPGGKAAVSRVRVLERRPAATLVEVSIETGRPHQIRIHLAAAGHPLVGDPLYAPGGGIRGDGGALPGDGGYLLHAERITLKHPENGAPFEAWCRSPEALRLQREM